jgi:ubiquitin carboxyl-terminal hydrolase 1
MSPHNHQIQDLFDGDPDSLLEYHQDYREGIQTLSSRPGFVLALLGCFFVAVYQALFLLDYNLLPLPELAWNILVYITPSRLLDAAETYNNSLRIQDPALKGIPRTHAAKSEAMRRLLGLDKPGGIIGSVAQAARRRASTLPGINIVSQAADGRPAGLGNWDNSCYQNSVLQGLASLNTLTEYLTNPKIEEKSGGGGEKPDMKMAEALRDLISALNDPLSNGRKIWTPAVLKNMSSWQQQDAQEYFSKVLDEIDKEVGKVAELTRTSQGFESDESPTSISDASVTTSFRNPMEGLIAQRVGCTSCGYSEGLSMIPFNCLTVPLGRAWEYRISECLDEYTKLEQIEGVECGKCTLLKSQRQLTTILERVKDSGPDSVILQQSKERLKAVTEALDEDDYDDKTLLQKCKIPPKSRVSSTKSRQAVIARPPRSLIVHFNRSLFDEMTGELKKNYADVKFPKFLNLGPWCLGSSGTTENNAIEEWILNPDKPMISSSRSPSRLRGPIYELRAVVTHFGRHENGHYICYRKHPGLVVDEQPLKEQWWRLSDEDVSKVSEESVLGLGGAFMLFYDAIEPASSPSYEDLATEPASKSVQARSDSNDSPDLAYVEAESHQGPLDIETLVVAASVPLPNTDDVDMSDSSDVESELTRCTREESIATTISDNDDEIRENRDEHYQPTKPIVVAPYIKQPSVHSEGEGKENQKMASSASLVMV